MLGAPKKCAKCDKQVYSIEELKCLDKIWHKQCFKCTVCSSLLNMKNYKGFDKQPYCYVHYPQQKHTVVSDNPEMLRIKENTKIQSNAKYHEDFEKSKGIYTVVADDPETRRVLENSKIISQVKYHEDFEKSMKNKNANIVVENRQNNNIDNNNDIKKLNEFNNNNNKQQQQIIKNGITNGNGLLRLDNTNNIQTSNGSAKIATYTAGEKKLVEPQAQRRIGSIADYDPLGYEGSPINNNNNNQYTRQYLQPQQPSQQRSLGGYPANGNGNSAHYHDQYNSSNEINNKYNNQLLMQQQQQIILQQQGQYLQHELGNGYFNDIKTSVYKAIYDYDAKEDDEISFRDGDKFINCEQIDVGWMIGVHEKTGKHGMFPSNYAEPIDLF